VTAPEPANEPNRLDVSPSNGPLAVAATLFLVAIACPIIGTAIIFSDLPDTWKWAAGFLYFPIPEAFDLTAVAIIGKPGFKWLKSKLTRFLRRHGPADEVSVNRYRFGLVLFLLPLVYGWLHPYFIDGVPMLGPYRLAINVAGDLMFLSSFFVLGGDFWDKIRALFIRGAKAHFPSSDS
jgi:hypothetical protein